MKFLLTVAHLFCQKRTTKSELYMHFLLGVCLKRRRHMNMKIVLRCVWYVFLFNKYYCHALYLGYSGQPEPTL